jgi:hypothetical protein
LAAAWGLVSCRSVPVVAVAVPVVVVPVVAVIAVVT